MCDPVFAQVVAYRAVHSFNKDVAERFLVADVSNFARLGIQVVSVLHGSQVRRLYVT